MNTTFPIDRKYSRASILLVVLFTLFCCAQIVRTNDVFHHTWDEPAHLAAGMQLLDAGQYTYDTQHPPLARLAISFLPWLSGLESSGRANLWDEGSALLYESESYERTLAIARLGVLPFFVLLMGVIWLWSFRSFGPLAAFIAVVFAGSQPAILAHSGLSTTDVPMAATSLGALFLFVAWLQKGSIFRGISLGVVIGLAFGTKYSAIPFLAVSFASVLLYRWYRERMRWSPLELFTASRAVQIMLAVVSAFLTLWSIFGLGVVKEPFPLPEVIPAVWGGIQALIDHNNAGHWSYLLGDKRQHGWWYFFPVAFAVKATIPLLVCSMLGLVIGMKKDREEREWKYALPGLLALSILAFAMMSNINIGVRHILLIFPLLAIQAAVGVRELFSREAPILLRKDTAILLLAWQCSHVVTAHPDYLSWFNGLAGDEPERILINGDLDWGQDVKRLAIESRKRGISHLAVALNGINDLERHPGLPATLSLEPRTPVTGWVAISLWVQEANDNYAWVRELRPVKRLGASIYLYRVDPLDLPETDRAQALMREALVLRYQLTNLTGALALFDEILQINPRHYGALWQRASVLQDIGKTAQALSAWEAVRRESRQSGYAAGEEDADEHISLLVDELTDMGR